MENKTYSECKGRPMFDWNAALAKEEISVEEWMDMDTKASDWVTCACGNLCDIIPRYENGRPEDEELAMLGINFCSAIENLNKAYALETLALIEQRSATLIKKLTVTPSQDKN